MGATAVHYVYLYFYGDKPVSIGGIFFRYFKETFNLNLYEVSNEVKYLNFKLILLVCPTFAFLISL